MDQNAKIQTLDCKEQRNTRKNMAKNMSTRSSSFGAIASSSNDSESVSTSPILDTAKIRRKGKLWMTRRAVSDSAFSPGLAKLIKGQKIKPFSSTNEKTKKFDNFSSNKEIKQCTCCDSPLNTDNQCKNCSVDKIINKKSDSFDQNLADRLRNLKCLKKPMAKISDLKDAQISDEEFVQSVRILDKVCEINSPKKVPQSPAKRLGLVPFVELEHLRLSQMKQPKNSVPIIHLSLDEDKEEDGDMFADKDGTEATEDFEEFTPWKYNSAKVSRLSFRGFSTEDCEASREIVEKISQASKSEEIDSFFLGFTFADIKESKNRLQNWEKENLKRNRENLNDIQDDKERFLSTVESKITQMSADVEKNPNSKIVGTENVFFNYKLKRKRTSENLSKTEDRCKKKNTNIPEVENEKFLAGCEKGEESREIITNYEVLSSPRIKYLKGKLENDSTVDFVNSQNQCGFSTAAGRPIKLSQEAIAKAKLLLSQEIESSVDERMDNFELDNDEDSQTKYGISNSDGLSILGSQRTEGKCEEKSEGIYEAHTVKNAALETESKSEVKTEAKLKIETATFSKIESIEDDLFEELDNVIDSGNKSGSLKAEESQKKHKDQLLDHKLDTATVSRISCGFSTAGGIPIRVSKTALEKAEARLAEELESIEDEVFNEIDDATDFRSKYAGEKEISKNKTSSKEILKSSPKKMTKSLENEEKINFGFTTAGGRELRVSEKSWTKSKAVFDTIEEPFEAELAKTTANHDIPMKNDSKINVRFSSSEGRELEVSEKSRTKSKAVFDTKDEPCREEFLKIETNPEFPTKKDSGINFGFSTAGGRELKVSENSWAQSKAAFDTIEEPCDAEILKTSTNPELPLKNDSKINFGFSTAGGRELQVSEKSWTKSKAVFDTTDEPCEEELPKITTNPEFPMKNDSKINFGFATAGGRELKVAENSWAKSKAVFDKIDESCVSELAKTKTPDPKNLPSNIKTKTMISGFSTANGQSINVTKQAVSVAEAQLSTDLDNIESLLFDDFADPEEESEASKKRKLEEIDDDTPLRKESSLKRKRGRYVNDLQARKLFTEDPNKEDEVDMIKKSSEKNLISEEVHASAAAFLEDEKRSNEGTTWQIDALRSAGSISPELGCEMANRSRADVSANNSFGISNRAELEKVKATGETENSSSSCVASSASWAETEEINDRAANAEKREEIQHESIPDDLTFDSQFSQDIQRSPVIDKFIADTMKIIEGRLAVALKQDEAIRLKRSTKIEQNDGFLYRLRIDNKESRTLWDELTDGIAPSHREMAKDSSGRDVVSITADSAIYYSFRCADFYGEMNVRRNIEGIKVGDGAFLVLDEKNCAGAREFERAFLASSGVDPNLVSTGWVKNHYRWIVWKLASMDRVKFGHKCLPRMLTPDRVMLELKYRYDREIYRTQWPPLRRILERGENASTRLVLCVSSIIEENNVNAPVKGANTPNLMSSTMYRMKVTDGWYSISTSIDKAMMNFIKSGKVREGTKLMIFGAKAVNLDQGCSVLEIPESVTLRIYSNSIRRAKWNTKLDFYHMNRGPMSLSLKSVKPNGGAISKLVVAVSRVYPILYREKLPDGQFVFRNARCDEEAARAHEARYQAKMEEIYANAWSEFQMSSMNRKGISATKSRSYTQEEATACGRDMEEELRQKISSKMSECLPTPRDVTPVIKMRIAEDDTCALVTVWPTDRDTTELFIEGSSIAIYNGFASGLRSNELQITAGRSTFVKREISRRISYPERIYTSLSDVTESGFNPIYGEFDTIGIVSSSGPAPHGMKNFETVNLACPKSEDAESSDFLSILFWQGVSAHGYSKILTVGSLVACSNLEWRRNTSRSIPTAYCTERSVFSKNPRQNHLVQAFESLRNEIKEPQVYAAACAAVIQEEIAKKSALRTPGNYGTPYRPGTSNNRTPGWSPRDLPIDATCTTPTIDSRKISTRKRLEKLEVYGEAPKLPPIVIHSSRKVSSDFRSPVLTPVTKS